VLHRIEPPEPTAIASPTPHDVRVEEGSDLADVLGATAITPMSWHHQAVDRLGTGLRAVAWAPDGVVEATELAGHPWLRSVQWHPELTAASDPTQQRLFDALVAACDRAPARTRGGNP
jgi:putative glutamine amidotransferase